MRLAVPFDTRHCQVVRGRESWFITNPNVHAKITRPSKATGNRMLVFSTRKAGSAPYVATAKFVVRLSPRPDTRSGAARIADLARPVPPAGS